MDSEDFLKKWRPRLETLEKETDILRMEAEFEKDVNLILDAAYNQGRIDEAQQGPF